MSRKKKQYERVEGEEWIEMKEINQHSHQDWPQRTPQTYAAEREAPQRQLPSSSRPEQPTPKQGGSRPNQNRPVENAVPERMRDRKKFPPSLPMMQATCDFCTVVQEVPGNTQVFICGSCQNMNECYPLYGVFSCGHCQASVGFGFGTSAFVKCPKCSSVNRVPIEPVKKYEAAEETMPQPPVPPRGGPPQYAQEPLLQQDYYPQSRGGGEGREMEGHQKAGLEADQLQYVGVQVQKRQQLG